ncbi:MAG TPA: helix-turn-helix domain-containing protein [Nitrososphaeraceae archaeon]|nr:helix-turn-helix domain-containing protein [Nitrososphaeraceae archaeon]
MTQAQESINLWDMKGMKCCPIDNTFKLIGKKFTVLIIRDMMKNKTRFNQFLDSIEGINPKILSARLKEMEKTGLIKRKVYSEIPVRVEYFITEKGIALKPILDQMASFSIQYCSRDVFKDGKPRTLSQTYLIEKNRS